METFHIQVVYCTGCYPLHLPLEMSGDFHVTMCLLMTDFQSVKTWL